MLQSHGVCQAKKRQHAYVPAFMLQYNAAPSNIMWLQNAMAHVALLQMGCMCSGQNWVQLRT